MSQLIELLWRNKAYTEGIRDPLVGNDSRRGAMFAGFKTEMAFDNATGKPIKKTRQEYNAYDRICVYPGLCRDATNDYNIGPENGIDPSALDLPHNLQIPRTIKTDVFESSYQIDKMSGSDIGEGLSKWQDTPSDGVQRGLYPPTDWQQKNTTVPYHAVEPGMMIRKRQRHTTDASVVSEEYTTAGFVEDLNYANAGDTTISIDLAESIAGVGCTLKKIVVQCSKVEHHISEIVLDFSDITRGSGSISSNENPQSNLLTVLLDGREKMVTAYYDVKMGKFSSGKFKLGLRSVKYFPPLACAAGGFDSGSQVAIPGDITIGCEKLFAPSNSTGEPIDTTGYMYSYPNSLRGIVSETTGTAEGGSNKVTGARQVADVVNQGYDLNGSNKLSASTYHNYSDYSFTPKESNLTTTDAKSITQVEKNVSVEWRMPGVSNYTFKPRQTRGSILAINVVLQADVNAF